MKTSSSSVVEDLLPVVADYPIKDFWDGLLIICIFAGLLGLAYLAVATPLLQPIVAAARQRQWSALAVRPTVIWVAMGFVLLVLRTALWLRYRPYAAATPETAPMITVIIPAYNEGSMVETSIDSVAAAAYPAGRLEILAIDDGSTDDTWGYIQRAAKRNSSVVTAVRLPQNLGKRGALAEGFRRAHGDVLVTIDSDSVIEPQTLLAIVGPFADPRVGAVAGKVAVYNRRSGLLPKMLHVRFVLAFDFLRSAQSVFRTVYCCPGALAAYRATAVREVIEKWEHQTFLGVRCTTAKTAR